MHLFVKMYFFFGIVYFNCDQHALSNHMENVVTSYQITLKKMLKLYFKIAEVFNKFSGTYAR